MCSHSFMSHPTSLTTDTKKLSTLLATARRRLLRMHFESGVGHIGGNLSALDILMVLHHCVKQKDDVFVLSKGHAAGALYVTLWSLGVLTEDDLLQFHGERTRMSAHPAPGWIEEIPFATGSLGHGLPLAVGIALGKLLRNQPGRVFCLLSDGELQEGSTWESLIFIKQRQLAPLTIVIDVNGLQGFGSTKEVSGLELTVSKFREFGLAAREIDGHDLDTILDAIGTPSPSPQIILAHTRKGHGISFMQNRMEWHYLPLNEELYRRALQDLESLQVLDANKSLVNKTEHP
ncbi:MAG: transketolase [Planctomycetota bacterium]